MLLQIDGNYVNSIHDAKELVGVGGAVPFGAVSYQMLGEAGSQVSLGILRDGDSFIFEIVRESGPGDGKSEGAGCAKAAAAGGVIGCLAAAAAPPAVAATVTALGFGAEGIAAGSAAASMMSASAIATGGGVPSMAAGGAVATLQSIGAAGMSPGLVFGVALIGGFGGAYYGACAARRWYNR